MGAIISSCWDPLPPLTDILLPTPDVYLTLLNIFQYFPLFTIVQWLTAWHPAGKTSMKTSIFNLPGRWAWFAMEIVSPLNLVYLLWKLPVKLADTTTTTTTTTTSGHGAITLPLPNKLLAALFVVHYLNRAIVSPFLAAPSMSPIHLFILASAMLFNWFNSTCLAGWLVGYDIPIHPAYHSAPAAAASSPSPSSSPAAAAAAAAISGILPTLGTALFLAGMAGNIYAERTLFRLRREEGARRAAAAAAAAAAATATSKPNVNHPQTPSASTSTSSAPATSTSNPPSTAKIYIIPPPTTPLFATILYPHYVCEWLEWTGFALAGTAVRAATAATAATASGTLHLAPWLRPAAQLAAHLGRPVPVPAAVFVVNAVTNMLPHARWGRRCKWVEGGV
ncbi:hypothetical protein BO86DRAFT_455597 [Aspergillus japonicus CBS 114.51]|uniref:Steroid 5-alpha reductase C-terminal domain-containing protein n=1 Tax=Aspergillus japonicus CBS 114.51 TaxID=1448312 RepID=A0A8T8X4Q7_ASPJA|nr:hypothetical protein BO86DRAFT_455597 [Aspergillus japonicus CBS 114.51]RAH82642.1 hypothetical protein BO86DRAFT_455597 [Aspergillus japonicus CBS 114.51]